jgi:hypothetical protein
MDRARFSSVKHAGGEALDRLEPILSKVRKMPALREKGRGTFYLRSRAFLHFHEDRTGLFADVRLHPDEGFVRMPATSVADRARLIKAIEDACSEHY